MSWKQALLQSVSRLAGSSAVREEEQWEDFLSGHLYSDDECVSHDGLILPFPRRLLPEAADQLVRMFRTSPDPWQFLLNILASFAQSAAEDNGGLKAVAAMVSEKGKLSPIYSFFGD